MVAVISTNLVFYTFDTYENCIRIVMQFFPDVPYISRYTPLLIYEQRLRIFKAEMIHKKGGE